MLGLSIRISCKVESTADAIRFLESLFTNIKYGPGDNREFEISLVELNETVPYLGAPISQKDWTNGTEVESESQT